MAAGTVRSPSRSDHRAIYLFTSLYVLVQIVLLIFAADGGHRQPDSGDYLSVARGLLDHGAFVSENGEQIAIARQPGYSVLLAIGAVLGGGNPDILIVAIQILMLWLTGFVTRAIVKQWLPMMANLTMALVILNPNAIGMAQILLPITSFALLITLAFHQLLAFASTSRWRNAVGLGVAIGAAVLFRPDAKFLIVLAPVILPVVVGVAEVRGRILRAAVAGGLATTLALLIVLPWVLHIHSATGRWDVSGSTTSGTFLVMNVAFAERRVNKELSLDEAHERVVERVRLSSDEAQPGGGAFLVELLHYPTGVLAKMFATSQIKWLVSGGAQNITGMLALPIGDSHETYAAGGYSNRISAWIATIPTASAGALAITAIAVIFAIGARAVGMLGLGEMIRLRHWPLLVSIIGMLAYYAAILLFNGLSRYRIPVEPALMVLLVYGLDALREIVTGRNKSLTVSGLWRGS